MKQLFLIINSVCDIACRYCFYTTGYEKRSRNRIKPEHASHMASRISEMGFHTVILTGGDPLHSRLKHETYVLIRELKLRGRKVIVNTSAVLLNDTDINEIITLGVDRVDISIDSHLANIHDAQRGEHANTARAIAGFIKRGYRSVATTTVVTEANALTLVETVRWLRNLGVETVRFQRVFLPGSGKDALGVISLGMRQACSFLPAAAHIPQYIELTEWAFSRETPSCQAVCQMGKEYFVCSANGTLTPCFHRPDLVLGNLFSDSTEHIEHSLALNALAQCVLPPCFGSHCVSLFDNSRFWRKA